MLQNIHISNKRCSFELAIQRILIFLNHGCHKIWSSTAVFNIKNNKKCFLSSKSAYSNDLWRIMWHWKLE